MARIRGRDTKPEMVLRRALHARGFRYRLHAKELPGRPDLVFPRYKAAVFIHGCFWHGHNCELFRLPGTRTDFWRDKIAGNETRDSKALAALAASGWRTLVVWECSMRGSKRRSVEETVDEIAAWLDSNEPAGELRGR